MRGIRHHGGRALVALAAVAALVAIAGAAAFALAPDPEDPNERLALRLSDLPTGYLPLDIGPEGSGIEFLCDGIQPTDPSRKLDQYVRRFDPVGCLGIYLRAYRVPDPAPTSSVVGTGALRANSTAGAIAGFAAAGELLGKLVEKERNLEEVPPQGTVGEATRLFHWRHIPRTYLRNDHLGSFLVWRSGRVVSAVFAAAPSVADSDRIALELAQHQQVHVEHPTVYTEAERDGSEVGLGDPANTFPVRWLGHDFAPGHGLPRAVLREAWAGPLLSGGSGPTGEQLRISYSKGIDIEGWTNLGWKHYLDTAEGHQLATEPCTKKTDVKLAQGKATIVAGHVWGFRPCAKDAPPHYYAFVHVGGTVVAVNFTGCPDCIPRTLYNSLKGMKAIVRGLELRPKPDF
ncbi:MAG TPA: hypothetical protein VLL27_01985 [Solirubrobacterales bacterium]|nr:hypothetical protein [Solirubrobacterales bacterium]